MAESITFGENGKKLTHIFIINPCAGGRDFATSLRAKLENISGIRYYMFNTMYERQEAELINTIIDMFSDEHLRIYCCGGSGTFRNIINGIKDLDKVELAFVPYGRNNDLLRYFEEDYDKFKDINALIEGTCVDIDYIKTNRGISVNSLTFGVSSDIINKMKDYFPFRVISSRTPYYMAVIASNLKFSWDAYEINLDQRRIVQKSCFITFSNGSVFRKNLLFFNRKEASISDGMANVGIFRSMSGFGVAWGLRRAKDKNREWVNRNSIQAKSKTISVRRIDGKPFDAIQDGEILSGNSVWTAEIVQGGLHFVVPKGVRV